MFGVPSIAGGRRPVCEESDDPAYACLLPRPPGAFDDEFKVYLSAEGPELSVKIVAPGAAASGGGRGGPWASLGFSPDGTMAGPSEAVVGALEAKGTGGEYSAVPPAQ